MDSRHQDEENKDRRAATIAATIANVMSSKGKRFKVTDFMPSKRGERQSVAEMIAIAESMTGMKADTGDIIG